MKVPKDYPQWVHNLAKDIEEYCKLTSLDGKSYTAFPCIGLVNPKTRLVIVQSGHICKVVENHSERTPHNEEKYFVGWMTLTKANREYGEENIRLSPSSSVCPPCHSLTRTFEGIGTEHEGRK